MSNKPVAPQFSKRYLRTKEAVEYLGIGTTLFAEYLAAGLIRRVELPELVPTPRKRRPAHRFDIRDLDDFMAAHKVQDISFRTVVSDAVTAKNGYNGTACYVAPERKEG